MEDSSDNGEEKKKDSEDSNPVHPPHSVIFNGISILLALLETRTAAVNCYNANQNQEYGAEFNSQNNSNELSSEDAAKQEATLKVKKEFYTSCKSPTETTHTLSSAFRGYLIFNLKLEKFFNYVLKKQMMIYVCIYLAFKMECSTFL